MVFMGLNQKIRQFALAAPPLTKQRVFQTQELVALSHLVTFCGKETGQVHQADVEVIRGKGQARRRWNRSEWWGAFSCWGAGGACPKEAAPLDDTCGDALNTAAMTSNSGNTVKK